ncbi:MAG: cellulase family glycosylhydrolase, partial [Clostridia bacterium]|nr:cellulase family glycosylhydrolase [Clostridia bacterium]MBQ9910251.1 cellulase family glycosylhydrolase [Lachnospiraceae bacterium]
MKRLLSLLLICVLLSGCAGQTGSASKTHAVSDGRDRPSVCGRLQVLNGRLCSSSGEPVMLRGVSSNGLPMGDSFINEALFSELSKDYGVNVFRIPVYTWGVGIVGFCTGGNQEQVKQRVKDAVSYAKSQDMYAIVDWHILQDGDPNTYLGESLAFFAE